MEEDIKKVQTNFMKELAKTILVMLLVHFLCQTISNEGIITFSLIAELGLRFLNVDEPFRILFLFCIQSFLLLMPSIGGLYCVNRGIMCIINYFQELATILEIRKNDKENTQTNMKTNHMNLPKQEEEIKKLEKSNESYQDIIVRFNALSREKQMKLLNFVKGLETSNGNDLANQINSLDKEQRDLLQTSMEDELFKVYETEVEKGFSRKKTKGIEKKDSTVSTD